MDQRSDTERHMQTLDEKELQCIVATNREGYTAEGVRAARDELSRRSCRPLDREQYYQTYPRERVTDTGFCVACVEETTDETVGNVTLHVGVGGVGTWLWGGLTNRCPACRSGVQSKWLWIFVPVKRLGRYRVIWAEGRAGTEFSGGTCLSRRMKDA